VPIQVLDELLINQIAAGEVVERPASVVKELVENSLDAGARTLTVTLRRGGREQVRIVDDGQGMDRRDAALCLQRHATSKIRTQEDLERVGTLGFRGEAIPSIAAVSRTRIRTRRVGDELGTEVEVEGGEILGVRDFGGPQGTDIDVRDLFYNIPARAKFLRAPGTELQHALEAVHRELLIRPGVDVSVHHDGRLLVRAPAVDSLAARARDLLGAEARGWIEVDGEAGGLRVRGLAAPGGASRSTSSGASYLYVNGRFVRDPLVRKAVIEGYGATLERGRHPFVVLDVQLDPTRVDVNAHPAKTEVRFRDPGEVAGSISEVLGAALGRGRPAEPERRWSLPLEPASPPVMARPHLAEPPRPRPPAHPADDPRLQPRAPEEAPLWLAEAVAEAPSPARRPPEAPADAPAPSAGSGRVAAAVVAGRGLHGLQPLGLHRGWLVCSGEDGLAVLDLRAALAHLCAAELAEGGARPRRLLAPVRVTLGRGEAERVLDAQAELEAQAVSVAPFGPGEVAVRALPEGWSPELAAPLMRELSARLGREERAVAVIGAMASVRAGAMALPSESVAWRGLLAALEESPPAGRPLLARFPDSELLRALGAR
jgi:DNA mismatch repair protein MutL